MGKGSHNYDSGRLSDDYDDKREENDEIKSNYSYRTDILSDVPKLNTIKIAIPAECIYLIVIWLLTKIILLF
jgi:hypothetical protein